MSCLNKYFRHLLFCLLPLLSYSCEQRQSHKTTPANLEVHIPITSRGTQNIYPDSLQIRHTASLPAGYADLSDLDTSIILDIRYAGTNNFTGKKLYPCSKCILVKEVAQNLLMVNNQLRAKGYQLVVLDCYRPPSVQDILWKIQPDPHYVMRPWKGSPHSRGIAVDVTLADLSGNMLDMGSAYDEFSTRSHYLSKDITQKAKILRWILRSGMKQAGFSGIRTEWWHFQMGRSKGNPIINIEMPCD